MRAEHGQMLGTVTRGKRETAEAARSQRKAQKDLAGGPMVVRLPYLFIKHHRWGSGEYGRMSCILQITGETN